MAKGGGAAKLDKKSHIFRNRTINSCKRCFTSKRKCDRRSPRCLRCEKINAECEYFTKDQIEERLNVRQKKKTRDKAEGHDNNTGKNGQTLPDIEINPQLSRRENENFTLIVNSTGEYSKFFPTCVFPFYDHATNVLMVLNPKNSENKAKAFFNFSRIVYPRSLKEIMMKIPSIEICDCLIDHFFQFIFPFVPIVDQQEFMYQYKEFCEKKNNYKNLNFMVVLFAIIFCSCTNLMILKDLTENNMFNLLKNKSLLKLNYENLRYACFECIENLKQLLNSDTSPSLSIIVGLTLIYYLGSSNGFSVTMQVSSLVKYAQIFGLHRKLTTESKLLPMRDVIYSFVWYLDGLTSYYTGFPPNMHYDFFECKDIYMLQSDDININFLSGRLCNIHVSNRLLFELNKINKVDVDQFKEVETLYLNSISIVNSINKKILNDKEKDPMYCKWLVTETRLGLTKSAVLLNVFRCAKSCGKLNSDYGAQLTTGLVLQAMLLINESIYRVKLGMGVMKESIWFIRYAIPFQAMYIVLSHIQRFPSQSLNFSMLTQELEYTSDKDVVDFDYTKDDIRLILVDLSIETLSFLLRFWHPICVDRFERILKFRELVKNNASKEKDGDSSQLSNLESDGKFCYNTETEDNAISEIMNSYREFLNEGKFDKNIDSQSNLNIDNISTNLGNANNAFEDSYTNTYCFIDEGSKFWLGEGYSHESEE